MNYEIQGKPYPVAIMNLAAGESVVCQRGAMTWMSSNMEMQTKGGGIGKMLGRALSGDSMFQNTYTAQGGPGMIAFASTVPGEIMEIEMAPGRDIVAQKSAFLASSPSVSFEMFFQKKLGAGFFGGEGFIMQRFSGTGTLLLEIDGSLISYELQAGQSMLVDTGNLAAMDATCSIDIQTVKGIGNMFLGGEGLFNTKVTGPGRVWMQTMPLSNLAGAIARFIPSKD
ncbi:MAG: TIGR00266 family protein [Oscillospiraceae bacterium]|nr:TIGR00266 family protein [Oscillospiraceae bacterium]